MRDSIRLIANSGLQFYKFEVEIDPVAQKKNKFRFVEDFDKIRKHFWLDEVVPLPGDDDLYARKSQLQTQGYITRSGKLVDESDIDFERIDTFDDTEFFESGNIQKVLRILEKKWIPIPLFKKNNIVDDDFGPSDWVRVYFEKKSDSVLSCVLLVDTKTTDNENDTVSPFLNDNANENIFAISENDDTILSFVDSLFDCKWVDDYLIKIFYGDKIETEKPFLRHIADYIFFVRMLRGMEKMPQVQLLSDKTGLIDVDLVIDVGNSKTCAILFENPSNNSFNFNTVKKLHVQDLEKPLQSYTDSFSTRLIFKETSFAAQSTELNQNNKFQWPSLVRTGFEAERTINDSSVELKLSRAVKTHNSSPKRYLWDTAKANDEWEYHLNDINKPPQRVYKKGISEQLNSDGSICADSFFGANSYFSRKSLMTFVYLEILCHAFKQINSIELRSEHGNPSQKRKLKRIVISCPTGMIREEQIAIRECAADAIKIINEYNGIVTDLDEENVYDAEVQVIPSVKDLSYNLENLEKRKDWIYDEATSAQLVYLYGMIGHKFNGDADLLFDLFGKKAENEDKNNLTVASLDIGGGTSDLMICKYTYKNNGTTEILPDPLFWESFNLAGDDLVRDLIQQIIIEGNITDESDKLCTGVIENGARAREIKNISQKLNGFFGKDSNNIGYKGKLMRTNFINQIAMPIVTQYMENANENKEFELTYEELFAETKPNIELLDYFEEHFGFRFEELNWKISSKKTNSIIASVFSKLIKQVSNVMHLYNCDLVVLAGRPCSFNSLEKLFYKYHSITPNRLINLNKFWIGRWYPFADNNGYINDPKTVVTIGCVISLMGGSLFKLENFKIDIDHLKNKLISTADFIGPIEDNAIAEEVLTPKIESGHFTVNTLPVLIGFKRIQSRYYPSRPIYSVKFNDEKITEVVQRRGDMPDSKLADAIEEFKHKIRKKMPLKMYITRDFMRDKERIQIEEVTDFEHNDVSKSYFELHVQTMSDEAGYWLDTGEFILNVK